MNLSTYSHSFSLKNKISRLIWNSIRIILFRLFGTRFFKKWRIFVLKCFGAKIKWNCEVNSSAKIWAPWNLEMGEHCCIGPNVTIYNQGKILIGNHVVISQNAHLCASSHDYTKSDFPLVLKPITIGNGVWIAADAFVGPNVIIGNDVVVAARAVVVKNVESNYIVGGNPAIKIKIKQIRQ